MFTRLLAVAFAAAVTLASLGGCRAEAEVDPDGRVASDVPAAR